MAHVHVVRHFGNDDPIPIDSRTSDDIPLIQRNNLATSEQPYRGNEWNDTRAGRNFWFNTASSQPRPPWLKTLDSIDCKTKQLTYLTIYLSAIIFTICSILLYILPNYECADVDAVDKQDTQGQHPHYLSFGRVWLSIMIITEAMGQWFLAKSIHFSNTDSQDIRYLHPDSPHSYRAWLAFGLTQCSRLALIYDILSIGETYSSVFIILVISCNIGLLIWYYLHPFKYGLKLKSAFITYIILSLELAIVLLYAYAMSDPNAETRSGAAYAIRSPIALLGAGLCQLWYALQLYPFSLLVPYDPWILETSNIVVWILMFVCYRAFENCV